MSDLAPDSPPTRGATLRAVILSGVLAVHLLAAAPLPQPVSAAELRTPVARDEVARWAVRLTALGYSLDAEQLGERVVSVSRAIGGTHDRLLAPFRPVFRVTGTGQGWALFANPNTWPNRLEVRVRRGAEPRWEVLYRRLDVAHPFQDPVIAYRRVRGVYESTGNGAVPRVPYRRFASWYADRLLWGDPDITAVEVRMVRTHTTIPPQPPDPRSTPRFSRVQKRQ